MKNSPYLTFTLLALVIPGMALANVSGTGQTLNSGQAFSLDTGAIASGGSGDILFTGTGISFVGSATGADLKSFGFSGSSAFSTITGAAGQATLSGLSFDYSASSIPLTSANANDIIGVKTNGGNYAAVLLTAVSSSSITIQYFTFTSGSGGSSGPTISQVLNNYGLIPAGFPNSGIAPSTLFIIKGSGLADPSAQAVLQSATASGGLPKSLNGATVSVTVGSTTVQPAFYYAIAAQLALVLPAGTPTGTAQITVTYNGQTSAPYSFQVVKSAPGIGAANGTGAGLIHAQDLNYNSYSYTNSIPPGSTIRLIGSGLGADDNPGRDTAYVTPSASDAINALAHVYVAGIDSTIFYQGPEGYPGLDEIDITLPENVPTGCFVSIVGVTAAGVPTNFLTIPIGTGVCQDSLGYNGTTLTQNGTSQTVNSGTVIMEQFTSPAAKGGGTTTTTEAVADFESYTGGTYAYSGNSAVSIGGCYVSEQIVGAGSITTTSPLAAGTISVTSPNAVSPQTVQLTSLGSFDPGFYATINSTDGTSTLPTGFLTDAGGTFTFTATAGNQVGSFTTQINFPNPLLDWTNQSAAATVVRANGLPVTWTGGAAGTYVIISGSSSNGTASGGFTCLAPVGAQSFTVPSYVLETLPATSGGAGSVAVGNETIPSSFSATGLNTGIALGFVDFSVKSTYQ